MKPPPRTRNKPNSHLKSGSGPVASKWQRTERRKLLNALKKMNDTTEKARDIDYAFLSKRVPTRSIPEIQFFIESLKDKVISSASLELKKRRWKDKKRKPIEEWTHMASVVTGTLENPISVAFSQMMTVASTEPRTLKNCYPPKVHRPPGDTESPTGHTIPSKPVSCLPLQGDCVVPCTTTSLVLKTLAPTTGPAKRLPELSKVVRVLNSRIPSPHQQPSTTTAASSLPAHSSQMTVTSSPTATSNFSSTVEDNAGIDCTIENNAKDHPRTSNVECMVDFERIYHYLSVCHKPNPECHLTPMESAIVLDLLMSLPEELSLLDCKKMQKHLIQVYKGLSSPANSKIAQKMFIDLKDSISAQTSDSTGHDSNTANFSQETVKSKGVTDNAKPDVEDSQFSKSNNASTQSGNEDRTGFCPPLNPFFIPLKLLRRQ